MLCSLYSMSPNQGGIQGWPRDRGHHFFFEIQNCFSQNSQKNKKYVVGNCTGHPFLNFLDPPLLMCAITCDEKLTTPLNSLASCRRRLREILQKKTQQRRWKLVKAASPRISSHECATLALLDTFSKGVTRKAL